MIFLPGKGSTICKTFLWIFRKIFFWDKKLGAQHYVQPSRSETPGSLLTLKKRDVGGRRSAVGGRRSGGADHFGRPALEGQLSEIDGRLSAVGTFSKLFFINDFLNKKCFRRFAPDLEGGRSLVISLDVAPQSTAAV